MGRRALGRDVRERRPVHRPPVGGHPARGARGRRRRRARRARGVRRRTVAGHARHRARAAHAPPRRPHRGERRTHRDRRDDRQRQADPRDGGPAARAGRLLPLVRGRGGQDPRRDDPRGPHELPHLHAEGARRGRRGDHAAELAGAAHELEARAGAPRRRPGGPQWLSTRAGRGRASTLEFAALVEEAGFPPGVFNVITGFGEDAGAPLVAHPGVDKVAFTGATSTGKHVMKGAAEPLARVSLELGGKSPHMIFADADLDAAANGVVAGIFAATGQTCMAGSRLMVQDEVYKDVLERLADRARAIRLGDPLEEATEMGPVAFREHLANVERHIAAATDEGARLVTGGGRAGAAGLRDGFFVEPTIFGDVENTMGIARDEVFGPVLAALRFSSEEEAVALANDTQFGLAAGVWTRDVQRAHRVARGIRAGTVWVNAYRSVGPMAPFGGYKQSGMGRENGLEAIGEYTETKTVWVELSGATRDPFKLG